MPFLNINDLEQKEPVPGYKVSFIHTGNMTLSYWTVTAGAEIPTHSHPNEQVANVIEGEFELTVDGVTKELRPGDVALIEPNVPHSGKAITACRLLDVFHPVREDYR
ncbi:MAG: cupin domain-containing protein [Candidatus Zixiibacteriota bacterium]|nr:MAG: cupin domain-containing protein [candidate division Zixibacteria bacterium]